MIQRKRFRGFFSGLYRDKLNWRSERVFDAFHVKIA
jgi:hypothetical protein